MKKRILLFAPVLVASLALTGCNLVSDPSSLTQVVVQRTVAQNGLQTIETALQAMKSVQNYQLKSNMQVATGRFVQNVNFYGTVMLPDTVSMDETIGNADYQLYQSGKFAYYEDANIWHPMKPLQDLKPWDSLLSLLQESPPSVVYQLPKQTVVSWDCNVYQFATKAKQGSQVEEAGLGAIGQQTVPHTALYTVWIDANDGQFRQLEVQSTAGVPGLGTESFSGTTVFFSYNKNTDIKVPSPLLVQVEEP